MTKGRDPEVAKRREQLWNIVAEHGPATTQQLQALIPDFVQTFVFDCPFPRDHDRAELCQHARQVVRTRASYSTTYSDLNRLLADGRIERGANTDRLTVWFVQDRQAEVDEAMAAIAEAASRLAESPTPQP